MLHCISILVAPHAPLVIGGGGAYIRAMSKPPDLDSLAELYLDLWQDQVTAMADSGADTMVRLLALMGSGAAGSGAASNERAKNERDIDAGQPQAADQRPRAAGNAAARAATAAAAPLGGDDRLAELAGRVAALEERIAALESDAGADRRKAPARPRKRP